jgi:hypothetical protein
MGYLEFIGKPAECNELSTSSTGGEAPDADHHARAQVRL